VLNRTSLGGPLAMHVTKRAPAKVNLSLLVGPKDESGFHELFTVFVPVDVHDELDITLEARPAGGFVGELRVKCRAAEGEDNLAAKALRALEQHTGWVFDGRVAIEKRIPVGAGLGGGSSDAAAALSAGVQALIEAGGPVPDRTQLVAMARDLGADVAFFLDPRPAIGRGIGEILEPIELPELSLVLVSCDRHLATERVYRAFDEARPFETRSVFEFRAGEAEKRWRQVREPGQIARLLENDLEQTVYGIIPTLLTDREVVVREGALAALVSGSGPTLFGLCASADKAEELTRRMVQRGYKAQLAGSPRGFA
jgi:4-diphosphocytidyl-2-C-methyl-D-erythritol kinase